MKRLLLVIIGAVAIVVVAVSFCGRPMRFRLESSSPDGNSHVRGLRFQGRQPHPLDGTLRVFIDNEQTGTIQQTAIQWDSDLKIRWKNTEPGTAFVIEKRGNKLMEFEVQEHGVKCVYGEELLAIDPYTGR